MLYDIDKHKNSLIFAFNKNNPEIKHIGMSDEPTNE